MAAAGAGRPSSKLQAHEVNVMTNRQLAAGPVHQQAYERAATCRTQANAGTDSRAVSKTIRLFSCDDAIDVGEGDAERLA